MILLSEDSQIEREMIMFHMWHLKIHRMVATEKDNTKELIYAVG